MQKHSISLDGSLGYERGPISVTMADIFKQML